MKPISVYIADDHPVVRKGMSRLLSTFKRIREVREASNGREIIDMISQRPPDVVIMDVEMPGMGGIDASKIIANRFPQTKIMILTMHTEDVIISQLLDIGIHGFLAKSTEPEEIERAIYSIVDKDFYKNSLIEDVLKKAPRQPAYGRLTPREIEVLLLICQELSHTEISARLKISEKTYFNHRVHILGKTGARSNVGLLKFALERGIVTLDSLK